MTTSSGALVLISDAGLRADIDRVAAAAGIPVVHAAEPSSRKVWTAAAAVLVDSEAAQRCVELALPRRERVVLVLHAQPAAEHWRAAMSIGAAHLIALPQQDGELVVLLSEAAERTTEDGRRGDVVAVIAGRGGAGASTFAAALAICAPQALLVDADPWSGGLDLLVGAEHAPGVRWPDLALRGGRVSFDAVREALPRRGTVTLLSNARAGVDVEPAALDAVVDAGRRAGTTVVCDLPRRPTAATETALDVADLVVVVVTAEVRACASATAMARWLTGINPNVGVVVRGPAPGGLRASEVAAGIELPLLAAMRPQSGLAAALERGGLRVPRRSPLASAAARVLAVLPKQPSAAVA
jgi:secretion/DNA translocation related CpaE-like protein